MGYGIRCHRCGKLFYVGDAGEYVFKRYRAPHHYYFCSWTCLRKFDEIEAFVERERRKNGQKKAVHGGRMDKC